MIQEQFTIAHIAQILKAKSFLPQPNAVVKTLLTDSRTVINASESLFFAINAQRNGHTFIADAYKNGIRNFVIADSTYAEKYADANFLVVVDVIKALQDLAEQISKMSPNLQPEEIQTIVYSVGKTHYSKERLREWFKMIYEVLFGDEQGPRMGSFISFYGIKETVNLINKSIND